MVNIFYSQKKAACLTGAGGPVEFKVCRDWFKYQGELVDTTRSCYNSQPPTNKECSSLYQQLPELRNITSVIIKKKKKVRKYLTDESW